MKLTLNFIELGKSDAMIAGGKGASLGEMTKAGIPVPPGFVVLSTTFDEFIKEADLIQEIDSIIDKVNHKEIHTVDGASEKIQALIKNAVMPERIALEIKAKFKDLDTEFVAVRSSATAEDGADNAWAGQLDSFLNTKEANLLEKVQHCWASLFTPRAIFYRFEKGLHTTKISVAVVVQKMVNSEVSGIAFSVHPVTEDRNQLIIEAGFGLGEAIVSGQVTPDSYVVEKEPRRIIDINVSAQTRALYRVQTGGNEWLDIPEPKASSQVLSETQILEFADLIMKIENHYGFPCDIEWAFEKGKFYIVQSRPITTLMRDTVDASNIKNTEIKRTYRTARARKLWPIPPYWNGFSQTDPVLEKMHGTHLNSGWFINHKEDYYGVYDDSEWNLSADIVSKKLIEDKDYLDLCYQGQKEFGLKLVELSHRIRKQDLDSCTVNDLLLIYNEIKDGWIKHDQFNVYPWFIGGEKFHKYLEMELGTCGMDQDEIITVLTPSKRSFSADEELEIVKLASESLAGKDIAKGIKKLVDKYYWIPFGYDGPMTYDESHYLKIIEETKSKGQAFVLDKIQQLSSYGLEIEKKQKEILAKYNIPLNLQKKIKDAYTLVSMTDERKEYTFQAHEAFSHVLQSLAKKLGVEYLHTKFVTPEEMLSDSRETLTSKAEKRMNGWMVGHFYDGNLSIIDGPEAEEMVKELLPKQEENVSIIRGTTGCKGNGVVQGTVRILSRVSEIVKMKEGEILVSQMTTPEFVPAMRKAIAIITDEGGVTCHAAIVSRELNIPCVIGTGIATKILKDGDMVEVDADKGVVRIISVYKNMESSDFREIIKYSDKDEDYDLSPEYKYFRIVSRKTTILSRSLLQIGYTSNAFYEKQIGYKTKHRVFYDSFRGINVSRVGIDFERETALQNFANDKNFLLKIINRGEEVGEKLWEYSYELKKVDYKVKTDGELIKYCGEFFDLQAKESSFLLFPLSMQPWLESEIKKQIKEVINDEKVAEQYFTDLVTPIKSNFHYNEQESILKMATEYQVKGEISEEKITNYLDKYGSTALKYGVGNLWTKEEVVDRLKSIDKPNEKRDDLEHFHLNSNLRVEQILKELNASESLKNLVKIIRTYVWFRTFRTDVLSHSLANAIPLFDEIGRRNNLSWEEVLECFPNEILLFKFPTRDEISERSLSSINYSTSGTLYYQYGKKAVAIIKKLNDLIGYKEENTTQATESVSGVCAYKGKVIGIVRIVLTNKDINKVKRNDIIVASMTTPDFIPAMERASAFVTDEGGILCHAAIVSREMKKPCVIGTKIATQAFKDGDMIEVDADKGIVRIIK